MQIVNRTAQRLKAFARRFACDVRGNVAMIFALVLPVLLLATLGGVDIHRASTVRMNLQDALDAATLAAARSSYTSEADLTRVGQAALRANLAAYDRITLASSRFHLTEDSKVIGDATVNVAATATAIFSNMPVGAHTEVNRSAQNVEVALVLDTTGSMGQGTKLADLKAAAKDLVDIVVQDQQSPWYSRVSIVPYAMAVNPGATAAAIARGPEISTPTNITALAWSTGATKTVSSVTTASPAVVTSNGHGFQNGDKVVIWGQTWMTQLNGRAFTVASRTANTFQLAGVDSRTWGLFNIFGTTSVAKCVRDDCYPVVTSANHGSTDGNYVYLSGIGGMTQLNGQTLPITRISANQFAINTVGYGAYTSGGQTTCREAGCPEQSFINAEGDMKTFVISNCVTERTGTNAYTDVAPSTARLGTHYYNRQQQQQNNGCLQNVVRPLSSNKTTIKSQIDALTAVGSTGGHIGVGWGWYTISPNFNSLWPSNTAGAYGRTTTKAVVIMTDGEYNSAYCKGIIAQDSTNGSGAVEDHINCNAPNGTPFAQSLALCTAMKAQGVIVYTVGFQVVNDQRARDLVNGCATDASHVYMPTSGTDLRQAFQAIGRDIGSLRISR